MGVVIDLFAGVGGMSLGFECAGFEILYGNEFDPEIATAYKYNHPSATVTVEDIRDLDLEREFRKFSGSVDVVVGGPPCQGFSQKGSRKSILDERNYLFRQFVGVVDVVSPRYFVMENVPNLLTNEGGLFKRELIELFGQIGYSVSAEVLNAANFGVPQNRRRAIIIGRKGSRKVSHPVPIDPITTVWDAISDLSFLKSGEGSPILAYQKPPLSAYQRRLRADSIDLRSHVATNHSKLAIERMKLIPPNCTEKVLPTEHRTKSIYSGTWTRLDARGLAPTITTRFDTPSSGQFTHPYLDRAITVREAARLQSFPDHVHFVGSKGSQMKQVGNAVPPLLSHAIAQEILKDMER